MQNYRTSVFLQSNRQVITAEDMRLAYYDLVAIRPYSIYAGLMNQTGTAAPTVIILDNSIGSIVWTRSSAGIYVGTLAGAFTVNKTFMLTPTSIAGGVLYNHNFAATSVDAVTFTSTNTATGLASDTGMTNIPIEIRVYN